MAIAAVYIGLMMVSMIYITIFRAFGWWYTPYAFTFIEYGFVYTLFLGSPWLIRNRGHVYIELLTAALPERWRNGLSRAIALSCAVICLIWARYSASLVVEDYVDVKYDEMRAQLDILRWLVTVSFPIGFFLMGIEFLRFVVVRKPMHTGQAGIAGESSEIEAQRAAISGER